MLRTTNAEFMTKHFPNLQPDTQTPLTKGMTTSSNRDAHFFVLRYFHFYVGRLATKPIRLPKATPHQFPAMFFLPSVWHPHLDLGLHLGHFPYNLMFKTFLLGSQSVHFQTVTIPICLFNHLSCNVLYLYISFISLRYYALFWFFCLQMVSKRGLISLCLCTKNNRLRDWKNVFTYSHLSSTHLWLRCCNFFNPSKKNSFSCAANRKIGNRKSQRLISTPTYYSLQWLLNKNCE
jgi:hypothetical protein